MKKINFLSIVIPAYNEENRITHSIKKITKYLNKRKIQYELLVVNDGSKDKTVREVEDINNKKIKLINNEKNMGKGYSVRRGFLKSRGDYVLFTDADLSTPIEELDKFEKFLPEYDIVIASRKADNAQVVEKQPVWRIFAGNMFPFVVRVIMKQDIKDTQCGFKLFDRKKCFAVFKKQTLFGFGFDVEILHIARKNKLKIKELGVSWFNDGETKVKLIKDSALMFLDLLKIRYNDLMGKYETKN